MTDEQFTPLAERYMDTVFRVAYSYLRCRDDADDVTQDVLIQLYKEDKAFESDAHVKNWLIRVTVNRCKNVLRAPWHKAEDIADYENTLVFEQPQYRELFDAVMSLDRRYRLPVLLYYYEGYRQREIAGLLGIPEETVRTRLARAREKLKHILSEVPHMHDRELFEKAFSPLHASPDTLTEVRKTMRNEKKTRRALGKGAVIAIAAALTLTVAVASGIVTLIKADVSPADKVDDATHRAFTDDIDAAAPVVDDGKGGLVPVPDMERIPGDVQTTQRLVGQYLSKLDAEMTVDSNTIKLGTFLIDENGLGLLTYSVENPSGVGYTDVGYGEGIDLPLQPTLHFRSPDEGNALFAKCYVDKETSTDTCLNVVLYFAAGTSFRQGDLLYVTMQDELGQPYSIAVQPRTYVPVATLTSGSETLTLSPLGMSIRNAHPDREPLVDELTLRYQDGSEFTVESSSRSLMNWVVGCMRGSDDVPFADNTYVFDRLVDVDAVTSVTLEGHQHTDGAADDTFTLTYQP